MPRYNGWSKDERIEEDSPLRLLEMKVHYLMSIINDAGLMVEYNGNGIDLPDEIAQDGGEFGSGYPRPGA
jgi:hypothetical protein